jgi:hypothetical protein
MVAQSPQPATQLTPLSPDDEALFHRFIEAGASLSALAASLNDRPIGPADPATPTDPLTPSPPHPSTPSLPSLYLWSIQPHIAPWLSFHKTQLAEDHKREMIAHLRDLAKTENPIERRRAATTILRVVGAVPVSHRHLSAATRTRISHASTDQNSAGSDQDSAASIQDSGLRTKDSGPSSSLALSTQSSALSSPLATPSPEISDSAAASLILSIVKDPRRPRNIATLRAFCMPTAKLAGIPIPTDEATFHIRALDTLITNHKTDHLVVRRARTAASPDGLLSGFRIVHCGLDDADFSFELRRESDSHPWLVAALYKGEHRPP